MFLQLLVFIAELTLGWSQGMLYLNHKRENAHFGQSGTQLFTRLKNNASWSGIKCVQLYLLKSPLHICWQGPNPGPLCCTLYFYKLLPLLKCHKESDVVFVLLCLIPSMLIWEVINILLRLESIARGYACLCVQHFKNLLMDGRIFGLVYILTAVTNSAMNLEVEFK